MDHSPPSVQVTALGGNSSQMIVRLLDKLVSLLVYLPPWKKRGS